MTENADRDRVLDALLNCRNALGAISLLLGPTSNDHAPNGLTIRTIRSVCDKALQETAHVLELHAEPASRACADSQPPINLAEYSSHIPDEFVVFDLETTGLDPASCEIIEIGAIRVSRAQVLAGDKNFLSLQSLLRHSTPIPSRITDLTGITQSMIDQAGVEPTEALREFVDFVGSRPLVAYNASFDVRFLQAAMAGTGLRLSNPTICALELARAAWPDRESYKLADIARSIDDVGDNHRAVADCIRTLVVYISAARMVGHRFGEEA